MTVPAELHGLIERFDRDIRSYRSTRFNEAQVRIDFINPLLGMLGWDVENRQGLPEAYREIIYEDRVKVGGGTKAPDYGFYAGGKRRFFLEAKKPSVNIAGDVAPAVQLRRYAWSAKLPLSILTDFEEFAIYDCRFEPQKEDDPAIARLELFTYDRYADEEVWTKIEEIFSREAVLDGSLEKYAEENRRRRGTETVDSAFLHEIEGWRDALARDLAARNNLNHFQLNYTVQMTIDRILFLRMAEDRGIEEYSRLLAFVNGGDVYGRLCELFREADDRYNSGLFHFHHERDRNEEPDTLTPSLEVSDSVLRELIRGLYYPESPYEFSVLPVDVLGQVYEQFLGSVIRLEDDHKATVEEKPEVRKAGGVYYTPTYIVDYIVKNTVGKLLEGKRPGPRGGVSRLKIVDPACGSGSFLIGAYQYLLDWHRDRYVEDGPQNWSKQLYQGSGGKWHLTIDEKKRILLNNIYGVDIDPQAVEVTKLSLLLKVLEGESKASLATQLRMFQERALPDLENNIKCGNSLIGYDFYDNQMGLLDDEENNRINVFDWQVAFPQVYSGGNPGFDAVLGNPPYIGFHGFMADKAYLRRSFISAQGKFDYYLAFIEQGLSVLRNDGVLGYICPTNFTKRDHGEALRNYLKDSVRILEICDFQDVQVFSGALNYTGVFLLEKADPGALHTVLYKQRSLDDTGLRFPQANLSGTPWIFRDEKASKVVERIREQNASPLRELTVGISEGVVTGRNSVFLLPNDEAEAQGLEEKILPHCLRGRQIRRYWLDEVSEALIYPYRLVDGKTRVMRESELERYPQVWGYLTAHREDLAGRNYFEASSKQWYELWNQRDLKQLAALKIVVPELANSNRFALADESQFYGDTVCGITILPETQEELTYILGVLNSKLMEFYYKQTTVPKANGFYIYKTMFLKNLPIRRISFHEAADKIRHDQVVELVDRMLSLHGSLANAHTDHEMTVIKRQIEASDRQLNRVVYELYGLAEEEVDIVEAAV